MNDNETEETLLLKEDYWKKDGIILGVDVGKMNINDNELTTLAKGLYFMSKNVDKPLFIYDDKRINNIPIQNVMIASFGSSGQFLKVGNDVNDIKMLAASGEGGSSFLGLSRLISQMSNLNHLEAIKMATSGDNWKVDLCIKDLHKHFDKLCELEMDSYQIKETTYNYGNYSGSLLSSKFGKVSLDIVDIKDIKTEDVVSSILHSTVSNNTRMMYLAAKTEDIKVAYVCGNFMTYNPIRRICLKTVNQCQGFFKGKLKVVFVEPVGYLGAVGAMADAFHSIIPE
ncbi:DgyrCDS10065 [Dimorphilus gyrociliatus]|uniref:DgyrCDS10065 n=1 Tax=Dimorphilus gyrociliatus TaxID=2664684 RepID=A0A7I8VZ11_9ANNE|nr:DgyrCDS10065 [Dimorphilus gyrociliatus]